MQQMLETDAMKRRIALSSLGQCLLAGCALLAKPLLAAPSGSAGPSPAGDALPRPASWAALLRESGRTGRPVVAMFSIHGCPHCLRVRRDHLRHLAREQTTRGVFVVELELNDRRPFSDAATDEGRPTNRESAVWPATAAVSPAALAAALGIRLAPTVAFIGPHGELAERLIGYQSADFYGAYLDDRIEAAIAELRRSAKG